MLIIGIGDVDEAKLVEAVPDLKDPDTQAKALQAAYEALSATYEVVPRETWGPYGFRILIEAEGPHDSALVRAKVQTLLRVIVSEGGTIHQATLTHGVNDPSQVREGIEP